MLLILCTSCLWRLESWTLPLLKERMHEIKKKRLQVVVFLKLVSSFINTFTEHELMSELFPSSYGNSQSIKNRGAHNLLRPRPRGPSNVRLTVGSRYSLKSPRGSSLLTLTGFCALTCAGPVTRTRKFIPRQTSLSSEHLSFFSRTIIQ